MLGIDIDDVAYVPVATALRIFNLHELQRAPRRVRARRDGGTCGARGARAC
jgi:hypothetical protein